MIGKSFMHFFFFINQLWTQKEKDKSRETDIQRDKCMHAQTHSFLCSCFSSSGFLSSFWCVFHLEALEEAGSRLQPPEHLCPYLCFPLQRSQFDFIACRKWQPACISPVFYKGNLLAVEGACWKHEESDPVLTTGIQDNLSPCCPFTLTDGDNLNFHVHSTPGVFGKETFITRNWTGTT